MGFLYPENMLLTIATTYAPATDLGYLLHKHPSKVQEFNLAYGKAHVFFPDAFENYCRAALLLELDPVSLIRGKGGGNSPLDQYVNDKPYICSSFMSVAISQVFGSALSGRCKERPLLVEESLPLKANLSSVPVRGGELFLKKLFEPLAYELSYERFTLPGENGLKSPYFNLQLERTCTLKELLTQLYVLLPVLDHDKHYWIGEAEIEKLLDKGGDWLKNHPAKDEIVKRYLKDQRGLTRVALNLLNQDEDSGQEETEDHKEDELEKNLSLNKLRYKTILDKLKERGVKKVLDLGCGEGKLLRELIREKSFTSVAGMDVSLSVLNKAKERLKLSNMPDALRLKINLFQSSLMYRDSRFQDYDALCVLEVIEHMDVDRLSVFPVVIFECARPTYVLLTTPNSDYNVLFENLPKGKWRHSDHRFEWTRNEFKDFCGAVSKKYGYSYEIFSIGDENPNYGAPTQGVVFTKNEI